MVRRRRAQPIRPYPQFPPETSDLNNQLGAVAAAGRMLIGQSRAAGRLKNLFAAKRCNQPTTHELCALSVLFFKRGQQR